jgi:hypothetical protein
MMHGGSDRRADRRQLRRAPAVDAVHRLAQVIDEFRFREIEPPVALS